MNPDDVKDHLVSKHLVGQSAYESLNLKVKTTAEKNRIIVEELCRGGIGTLEKFLEILKSAKKTAFVAEKLEEGKRTKEAQAVYLTFASLVHCKIKNI